MKCICRIMSLLKVVFKNILKYILDEMSYSEITILFIFQQ